MENKSKPKPRKLPTRMESDLYDALTAVNSVLYRLPGCAVPNCIPCNEHKAIRAKVADAISAFETQRRYK